MLGLSALSCRIRAVGCFKSGGAHFQRNYNARKSTGKQSCGKGNQSKSWSMSEPSISGKGKSKENKEKSKGTKSENKGAKGSCKGKTLELGRVENDDRSWIREEWSLYERTMAVVLMNGMMTGVVLNGTKVGNKHMSQLQAHFHLKALNGRR